MSCDNVSKIARCVLNPNDRGFDETEDQDPVSHKETGACSFWQLQEFGKGKW